ncbi:hypothetical protein C0992_005660 [Termitomyces sp. T32_za158]|nr:hypothetical protein C0992_005660 [Termitomyces sp. T32_za158]
MTDSKRLHGSTDKKKKKYRSDGTPIWAKRYIDGPGIWVSCVKGKERQAVAECYDLFDSVASELWPIGSEGDNVDSDSDDNEDEDLPIETQIANEVSAMKKPKQGPRFGELRPLIELRVRNHSVISRPEFIQSIAQCVPEGHAVELTNPEVFILVEVFKSVCGISIVRNYYDMQKFNMSEIANSKNGGEIKTERQVFGAGDP